MLEHLNDKQKECVLFNENRPLLIEAGPGSGKTRVLIEKVKYLLSQGKNPESFLIITFTIKAANELKTKLLNQNINERIINKMQISTIHSFCLKLLEGTDKANYKIYAGNPDEKKNMFLLKHIKELGFKDESYVTRGQLSAVIDKFEEYSLFDVDTKGLVKYLKENRPVNPDFINFIKEEKENTGSFPRQKIELDSKKKKDKRIGLKDDWYDARYLQVAKSYPLYKKLLNENNLIDFNFLQINALNLLKNNPKTQYTNILIDEFQDTDPIQIQLFEILMKEAMEQNGSFTAVGDADQSIYGFRGSLDNYFEYLYEKYGDYIKKISLDYNYRSTNQIIGLSEFFIQNQRSENSEKLLKGYRNIDKDSFFINNSSKEDEAYEVTKIIKYLHEERKLNYNDISILSRSVINKGVKSLIKEFKENNIPYQIKGFDDLEEQDEIKSILTLIYYLIESEEGRPFLGTWNKDWLNLKAFTDDKFNQVFVNLSDETKEILFNLQEKYESEALAIDKILRKGVSGYGNISKFKGIFERREDDYIEELFKRIERPILTNENLIKYGVKNKADLEFFKKFNILKEKVKQLPKSYELDDEIRMYNIKEYFEDTFDVDEIPTILDIFYELLEITGYLNKDKINNPCYRSKIENIALLTNTMYNYENIISKYDLNGFYWYLSSNLSSYGTSNKEINGVQIMTIHKSKGLEFPVAIVLSLSKPGDKKRTTGFPKKFFNPAESNYIHMKATYYTPFEYLKYKNLDIVEEERAHYLEEERIIYVAMTRAEDMLILSCVDEEDLGKPTIIQNLIDNNPNLIKELTIDNLDIIPELKSSKDDVEEDKPRLSFTSISNYQNCPLKYKLYYNFEFKVSNSEKIIYGNIAHESLDFINKIAKEREISIEEIDQIIEKTYKNTPDIPFKEYDFKQIKANVHAYWDNIGSKIKVLDSEYPFNIKRDNFDLMGSIDLIYETKNGNLGILDYKNTENIQFGLEKYRKQLETYALALKLIDDCEYSDRKVEELCIYSIPLKDKIIISLDEINVNTLLSEIEDIAQKIMDDEFEQNISNKCKWCKFRFVCGI